MQRIYGFIACLTLLTAGCTDSGNPADHGSQNNFTPADPADQITRMSPGVNFGNALEAPNEGDWGLRFEWHHFSMIHEAGFNVLRIPIRWSAHAEENEPYTISPSFFERIDWVVAKTLEEDMIAVIAFFHYDELFADPQGHKTRFKHLWAQIAERYAGYHEDLVFELLNEPHDQISRSSAWNTYYPEILDTIRVSNPERNVIVGGGDWNNVHEISKLVLPENDRHLIATFHYYLPFQFTHQGAEWVDGSEAWLGTTWTATAGQRQEIIQDFQQAAAWSAANACPVFMGEFGAYSRADINSRVMWTEFVARQAGYSGFGWAYWEFASGFGVYDPAAHAWNTGLMQALVPGQ
ncbi:glycoside hydrolase family 5 protein [bacterium]|nr:glycoside hydrolase family 5 protein [bacterium]